jgi:P4 family phage/plasmid primase-like protien
VNVIAHVLGDYATTAATSVFTAAKFQEHPTELADLKGARLVSATETEEGAYWQEAKLKAMTGGDRIKARFMRQDFFEFTPQFKIVITGNHHPQLRNVDAAMRRRLHIIPFNQSFAAPDHALSNRLICEAGAILQWAIEGCLEWQRIGLAPPSAVTSATEAYFEEEDAIGAWIREVCVCRPGVSESSGELYASWSSWAAQNEEDCGTQKRFATLLQSQPGIKKFRSAASRGFEGIALADSVPCGPAPTSERIVRFAPRRASGQP